MKTLKTIAVLFALLSFGAFAQPQITRGDALRHREFRTYSTLDVYVDRASGDDTFPCTSTLPCQSFARGWSIVPYWVPEGLAVTLHIAAGTYPEGLDLSGRRIDGTLDITGDTAQCGTGVIGSSWNPTAVTTAGSARYVLLATGVAMTANVLRGCHLTFASGTGVGQISIVRGNTSGGVIELSTPVFPDPTTGTTMKLTQPASIFTGLTADNKINMGAMLTGGGRVTVTNIRSGNGSGIQFFTSQPPITFTENDFTVGFVPQGEPTSLTLNNTFVTGGVNIVSPKAFSLSGLIYCPSCVRGFATSGPGARNTNLVGSIDGSFSFTAVGLFLANANVAVNLNCSAPSLSWNIVASKVFGNAGSVGCTQGYAINGQSYVGLSATEVGAMSPNAVVVSEGSYVTFFGNPFSTSSPVKVDSTTDTTANVQTAGFLHGARGSTLAFSSP